MTYLGGEVDGREEKYGLDWHGKRQARQLALAPPTGTLRPCPEESVDWDATQNLLIEGDNLEVMKLLQKSHAGKVKLIYIDPPYNTGKGFLYRDNFRDSTKNYLKLTGQVDGNGHKTIPDPDVPGRFHTGWLDMMYPRLKLSRVLLGDDGAIFISIDDHEVHNLRSVMDEIYGPQNFIATVIWQRTSAPKNSTRHFSVDHEYLVVYARSAKTWASRPLPRTEKMDARYSNPDNDPRGNWLPGNLSAGDSDSKGTYPITCPSGRVVNGPPLGRHWCVSRQRFDDLNADKRIWWGAHGNNVPSIKRFLSEVKAGRAPRTLWTYDDVGHTGEAKKELLGLVAFPNSASVFQTPKPTRLIRRILQVATNVDDRSVVLDFFAGSGSTMHAVFAQNSGDCGNRRCILVQLPEPIAGAEGGKLDTIFGVAKERLRGAAKKVRAENPMFAGDLGFRVFGLDSTNIRGTRPDCNYPEFPDSSAA